MLQQKPPLYSSLAFLLAIVTYVRNSLLYTVTSTKLQKTQKTQDRTCPLAYCVSKEQTFFLLITVIANYLKYFCMTGLKMPVYKNILVTLFCRMTFISNSSQNSFVSH